MMARRPLQPWLLLLWSAFHQPGCVASRWRPTAFHTAEWSLAHKRNDSSSRSTSRNLLFGRFSSREHQNHGLHQYPAQHDDGMQQSPAAARRKQQRTHRQQAIRRTTNPAALVSDVDTSSTFLPNTNILLQESSSRGGDGGDRKQNVVVNRVLAERIFHWEQELRHHQNLPKVDYSIRSGLRLVERLVEDVLSDRQLQQRRSGTTAAAHDNVLYSDLVQEGLAALLDAMKHYREEEEEEGEDGDQDLVGFEEYAKKEIQKQLEQSLARNVANRPIRLPKSVLKTVQRARAAARELQQQNQQQQGRISMNQVAEQLGIPADQLRDYLKLVKQARPPTLSMESTVEISHPLLDETIQFTDQDEWERQQSMHNSHRQTTTSTREQEPQSQKHEDDDSRIQAEQWISEYKLDDLLEGDDQAWIVQQEQTAGSLTDLIPDTEEPSPDDLALREMIRSDLYKFLATTLTEQEHAVIRAVFGLDTGKQLTLKRTAELLKEEEQVTEQQVSVLLAGGLQKLRDSYTKRYIEPYLEEGELGIDSV